MGGNEEAGFLLLLSLSKDAVLLLPKWILNHLCFFEHLFQMPWQEESNGTNLNHMWAPINCFLYFLNRKYLFSPWLPIRDRSFFKIYMMADSLSIWDLRWLKKTKQNKNLTTLIQKKTWLLGHLPELKKEWGSVVKTWHRIAWGWGPVDPVIWVGHWVKADLVATRFWAWVLIWRCKASPATWNTLNGDLRKLLSLLVSRLKPIKSSDGKDFNMGFSRPLLTF